MQQYRPPFKRTISAMVFTTRAPLHLFHSKITRIGGNSSRYGEYMNQIYLADRDDGVREKNRLQRGQLGPFVTLIVSRSVNATAECVENVVE